MNNNETEKGATGTTPEQKQINHAVCVWCGHRWEYEGEERHYASCPRCFHVVPLELENRQRRLEDTEEA